jgi:hypothetical protein
MESPIYQDNAKLVEAPVLSLLSDAALPARRITDITPARRETQESNGVPTSPKLHELIERSKYL